MMRHLFGMGVPLLFIVASMAPTASAAPIVAGTTDLLIEAVQDITLLPGTPLNPGTSPVLISGVTGYGVITLNRDAQVGTTINIPTLAGGLLYGSNPGLPGTYVFGNIPPLTGASFSGSITDVVQNTSAPGYATGQPSSFQSGNFSFGGNSFGFEFLTGPFAGVTLFTDPTVPFSFAAPFDGLPPTPGTTLVNSGTDFLNVQLGGATVAQSSNRQLIVVAAIPEPSSLVLGGLAAIGIGCGYAGRRRRRAPAR
jgi:PEP-CTERM motif